MGDDHAIRFYDDSYGPLWISRNSIGINGVVRARTFKDAYGICEDEFFPDADETMEELIKEYAVKVEHVRITDADGNFVKWETVKTRDENPETQWETIMDNECFQEAFGFRPNGPNKIGGSMMYQKDLNGDYLDKLTPELMKELDITCHYSELD